MNDFKDLETNTTYLLKDTKGSSMEFRMGDEAVESINFYKNKKQILNLKEEIDKGVKINGDELDIPFSVVEVPPIFPGCEDAEDKRACFQEKMFAHISKNFRYPEEAQKNGIQGKVYINFIIGSDGNVQKVRTRGPNVSLEEEAERIIAKLPKLSPGLQRGKAVNVPFSIPITFKLE